MWAVQKVYTCLGLRTHHCLTSLPYMTYPSLHRWFLPTFPSHLMLHNPSHTGFFLSLDHTNIMSSQLRCLLFISRTFSLALHGWLLLTLLVLPPYQGHLWPFPWSSTYTVVCSTYYKDCIMTCNYFTHYHVCCLTDSLEGGTKVWHWHSYSCCIPSTQVSPWHWTQ
jgi:hypothetical protein